MVLHWGLLIVVLGTATANDIYKEAVHACLFGHNDVSLTGISLEECKQKCSSSTVPPCNSIDYLDTPNKWNKKYCYLSKETKATQAGAYKEPCPGRYANIIYLEKKPAVDGGWSAWGVYGACSATCGEATSKRERTCTAPAPQNGGAQCDGPSQETVDCGLAECATDGGWSAWGDYEACSATCGQATKKRERTCTAPAPKNGGAQCGGPSQETVDCDLAECVKDCDPCEYGRCDRGGRKHCINFGNKVNPRYNCILPSKTCPPPKKCFKYKNYLLYTETKDKCSKSLQEQLDHYCQTTLPKETPACSNMNFARNDGQRWRCFKSVNTERTALACVDKNKKMVKCSAPVTDGGLYCTKKQLDALILDF